MHLLGAGGGGQNLAKIEKKKCQKMIVGLKCVYQTAPSEIIIIFVIDKVLRCTLRKNPKVCKKNCSKMFPARCILFVCFFLGGGAKFCKNWGKIYKKEDFWFKNRE